MQGFPTQRPAFEALMGKAIEEKPGGTACMPLDAPDPRLAHLFHDWIDPEAGAPTNSHTRCAPASMGRSAIADETACEPLDDYY